MRLGESTDVLDHDGLIMKIAAPFAAVERCSVRDSEAYSDIVTHFVKCKETYDSGRGVLFSSYAGNMARRVAYRNMQRRLFRRSIVGFGVDERDYVAFDAGEAEDVDNADLMEEVRIAMEQLDPRMRDVIERRLRREKFVDIGAVHGFSKAYAERTYNRAVQLLRDLVLTNRALVD